MWRWLVLLLPLVLLACPATRTKSRRSYDDLMEDVEDDDYGGREDRRGRGRSRVRVDFPRLPDAVIQNGLARDPAPRAEPLRDVLCEGHERDKVIYYLVKVKRHWQYYWLCGEREGRRASSLDGARSLTRWLRGFRRYAEEHSSGCGGDRTRAISRSEHDSGVTARAHCDGRIVLRFPDGGRRTVSFTVGGGSTGTFSSSPGPSNSGGGRGECPPCDARDCPPPRVCPPPPKCPPQRRCPPRRVCPPPPKCDCKTEVIAAGKAGFKHGIRKACAFICKAIHARCRKINPKTAMCQMLKDYCLERCK